MASPQGGFPGTPKASAPSQPQRPAWGAWLLPGLLAVGCLIKRHYMLPECPECFGLRCSMPTAMQGGHPGPWLRTLNRLMQEKSRGQEGA